MPRSQHLASGRAAELQALRFLQKRGLNHVASNYRCRLGELDLIMQEDDELVVVEIRYRHRVEFIDPAETITRTKRCRIGRATGHFVQHHPDYDDRPVRFDVVCVSGPLDRSRIRWIPAAFTTEDMFDP